MSSQTEQISLHCLNFILEHVWHLNTNSPVPDWVDDIDSQGERITGAKYPSPGYSQHQSTLPSSSTSESESDVFYTDRETPPDVSPTLSPRREHILGDRLGFEAGEALAHAWGISDTDHLPSPTVVEEFPGASDEGTDDELIIERTRFTSPRLESNTLPTQTPAAVEVCKIIEEGT